jgi:peptidyl-prolyl cis-trans isomerase B (cyclophilin B)
MRGMAPGRALGVLLGVAAAAAVLAACGGGGGGETSTSSNLPEGCQEVAKPPPKHVKLKPPQQEVRPGEKLTAVVETSCGTFDISLDTQDSPKTVGSFVYMADKGVYDDTAFHRIVPNFVIQGGDPLGTGEGGPGYSVDEPPPPRTQYTKGTVAMAKTAVEPAGRSGSQFFVVTTADAGLPPQYAVLGKVSSGQSVVNRIASLGSASSGQSVAPLATVVVKTIKVKGG